MAAGTMQSFQVQWHLTEQCNLRCRHCYQSGSGRDAGLGFAEAAVVLDEIDDALASWSDLYGLAFERELSLTGGEPLLWPDLERLVEACASSGFRVSILTNGTLLDRKAARALAAAGVAAVQVSLEGPRDVHDKVRGDGAFERALEGVKHLQAAGLPVTLNATLSRLNAPRMGELLELARNLGVPRLGFSRLVPSGRGESMRESSCDPEELFALYSRMAESARQGEVELVTSDPLAMLLLDPPEALGAEGGDYGDVPVGGCAAGVSGLTIMPDLTLLPCRRLAISLGNLRTDSLREIWAASPLLCALRDRSHYRGACRECRLWAVCRGCRAVAHAVAGDPLAEDSGCIRARRQSA